MKLDELYIMADCIFDSMEELNEDEMEKFIEDLYDKLDYYDDLLGRRYPSEHDFKGNSERAILDTEEIDLDS